MRLQKSGSWTSVLAVFLMALGMGRDASAQQMRVAPALDGLQSCKIPQYPPQARRMEQQGTVVLRFLVSPDGTPTKSEIASSSGFPDLDKAAQDALMLCHFKPATIDGRPDPQPAWALLRYNWKLDTAPAPGAPVNAAPPLPQTPSAPFILKCSAKPSAEDFTDQLATVAAGQKTQGRARLVLPPATGAPGAACAEFYHRAQIEAMRRAALFDQLDVEETGVEEVRPRAKDEDYLLWLQGGQMVVAYHDGPRAALPNNGSGLAAWARQAPNSLKQVHDLRLSNTLSVNATWIAGQPYIAFRGKEYLTTADLEYEVRADADAEARAIPSAPAIGKRARVIIASETVLMAQGESQATSMTATLARVAPQVNNPFSAVALSQLSSRMVAYSLSQGWAQALRQSGLFKTVEIDEADAADQAVSGYDAVIWNDPAAPFKWKLKDSNGGVHDLALSDTAGHWIEQIRTTLGERR
jgi:TonB family protein